MTDFTQRPPTPILYASKVLDFAEQLERMSSTIAKQRMIKKEVVVFPQLGEILFMTMVKRATYVGDSLYYMLMNHIEKMPDTGAGMDIVYTWDTFGLLYEQLCEQQITGNYKFEVLSKFFNGCNKATALVYLGILHKDLFSGMAAPTVNNAMGYELVPTWGVQLCKTYQPERIYKGITHWWGSPKINGFRCTYKNGTLFSRAGHVWEGACYDSICEEVKQLQEIVGFNLFDGELFAADAETDIVLGTDTLSFQGLSSFLKNESKRKDEHQTKKALFYIFAAVDTSMPEFGVKNTFDMLTRLHAGFLAAKSRDIKWNFIRLLPQMRISNTSAAIIDKCSNFMHQGFEGIVLRHPDVAYEQKRSSYLLKFKLFKEMDLFVESVESGTGKYANIMGAIVCTGEHEGKKMRVSCGSGFTDKQRKDIWEARKVLVGRGVTVKYQDLTDANFFGEYSLMFPIFINFRENELN